MSKRRAIVSAAGSIVALLLQSSAAYSQSSSAIPTFYRAVVPILQKHCQNCHRPGEMAFPLMTYGHAAPRARAIRDSIITKKMPPWFADPSVGHFANDPSLSTSEIKALVMWAENGAPAGNP